MIPEINNTFCYYPFYQLALKKWDSESGIRNAAPCCNAIRPDTPDPLQIDDKLNAAISNNRLMLPTEIFYGAEMTELRESMLQGKKHPACSTCWKMEDKGNTNSYRFHSKPVFNKIDKNIQSNPVMRSIDLIMGENCNLRCRMCSPGLSNSLRKDYKIFSETKNTDANIIPDFEWYTNNPERDKLWRAKDSHNNSYAWVDNDHPQWQAILDDIHNIRHIKATGGETTITKSWLEFLDYAIETGAAENIVLEFHTNATKFTDTLVDKFKHFEKIYINLSIDSIGKNYEYLRYPMKWPQLCKSLQNLFVKSAEQNIKNLTASMNPIISALNIHYLKEISDWWINDVYSICKSNDVACTIFPGVVYPDNRGISIKYLPIDMKQSLLTNIIKLQDSTIKEVDLLTIILELSHCVNYRPSKDEKIKFFKEIRAFDTVRKQKYHDYCHAEISAYLDSIAAEYNLAATSPMLLGKSL